MTTIYSNPSQRANASAQPRLIVVPGQQATVAAATVQTYVVEVPCRLLALRARTEVGGISGTTTVVVQRNGVAVSGASISIANTVADPSPVFTAGPTATTDFVPGDLLSIVVTVAAGSATGLSVQAVLAETNPFV